MPRGRTTRGRSSSRSRTRSRTRVFKKAEVGRFDGEYKTVAFKDGDTVSQLLDKAGIDMHSGEEINDDRGNTVKPTDKAKEQTYHITGNYKNGM